MFNIQRLARLVVAIEHRRVLADLDDRIAGRYRTDAH
jgi:hypothetical protein